MYCTVAQDSNPIMFEVCTCEVQYEEGTYNTVIHREKILNIKVKDVKRIALLSYAYYNKFLPSLRIIVPNTYCNLWHMVL